MSGRVKIRADGERNRERVIVSARAAFLEAGANASLTEIAQRAGVGIGTLYRHFPNRTLLIEDVYRREVDSLVANATELREQLAPDEALERWLKLAVEYIATKKIVAPVVAGTEVYGAAGQRIVGALTLLVEHARESGAIREETTSEDVLRALVGFTYGHSEGDWQESAMRLIDILMRGLRR